MHLLEMSNIVPVFVTVTPTQPLVFYDVSTTHEVLYVHIYMYICINSVTVKLLLLSLIHVDTG